MTSNFKQLPIRDRAWLDAQREERCIISGQFGNANESVVPMHVGTRGKGVKSSDDEVIPVLDRFHKIAHQSGEISMLREHAPDDLLREAFRALARERYQSLRREKV